MSKLPWLSTFAPGIIAIATFATGNAFPVGTIAVRIPLPQNISFALEEAANAHPTAVAHEATLWTPAD